MYTVVVVLIGFQKLGTMRVVSYVDHLEFEFEGNISKNAICLGDIDNDGQNELIVGNEKGVLAIFKGEKCRPVQIFSDLGIITAVAVGDVFNFGHNVLVACTGCGICYIYDFENVQLGDSEELQPLHVQHIPANVKDIIIGDVNGDGLAEMVVGLTDRVVRTYRWVNAGSVIGGKLNGKLVGQNKWELVDQIGNISLSECSDGSPSVLAAQPGGTYFTLKARTHEDSDQDPFDEKVPFEVLTKMSVFYHGLASSRLRNPQIDTQIVGNIRLDKFRYTSSFDRDGNGAVKFEIGGEDANNFEFPSSFGFVKSHLNSGFNPVKSSTDLEEEAASGLRRSSSSPSERSPKTSVGFAVATLDGTLMLVHDGKIQWNLQVDHQLFAVHAMDVTQNGRDEVIACAWDGNTYIVCDNTVCVRFTFPHRVNAFKAGLYGIKGKQVPSLVYVTFNNRIYLYPDITMPHISTTTVTEVLKSEPRYLQCLEKLGIDASDKAKLKEINHYLLYGKCK